MARSKIFPALSFLYSLILLENHARVAAVDSTESAVNCPSGEVCKISNDQQFNATISALHDKLVVVDYTAPTYGQCEFIAEFAKDYPNVTFLEVDIKKCSNTAHSAGVGTTTPTFISYLGMKQLSTVVAGDKRSVGKMIEEQLSKMDREKNDPNIGSSSG